MVLAVPPLDESAIFTQIPLSEDLIPLDDLGASGGYGRQLILPDDVPPVLALPWALGPRLPRVNRAEDDGSLHVFVKGGSGLGGAPYKQLSSSFSTGPGGGNDWQIFASHGGADMGPVGPINVLYGAQWSMVLESAAAGTHYDQAALQLYPLPAQVTPLDLFAVPLAVRSTDFGSAPAAQQGSVQFGPGIDMAATFPGNAGFELWMHGGGNFTMWFVITLFYS